MLSSEEAAQRQRVASRDAKRKRRGRCIECGAETHYSGNKENPISLRCRACGSKQSGMTKRGRGDVGRALELLHTPRTVLELADVLGTTRATVHVMMSRLMKSGDVVRVKRGVYRRKEKP